MRRRLAIVGAGWAGMTAAVRAVQIGFDVTVFEMSHLPGGRARTLGGPQPALDNGQHILIGAYSRTLALMNVVGADASTLLHRMPLALRFPDGAGLSLPPGSPVWSLVRGIAGFAGLGLTERLSLMRHALAWAAQGFKCSETLTVDAVCAGLAPRVRQCLIDPLCVAAMNTPACEASASVFLRVLHDAVLGGRGSADLMLPRRPLSELLPQPAWRWLGQHGAALRPGQRVQTLIRDGAAWRVDGESFDAVVLACTSLEAARLAHDVAPDWARVATALRFEPIVTVYARADGVRLPMPITALRAGPNAPAQFVFDLGQLGATPGHFACVVSGARQWVDAGLQTTGSAVLAQLHHAFAAGTWPQPPTLLRTVAEKRATFLCTPSLQRPSAHLALALVAAGDFIEGPYPATLEGAVRSGERAIALLGETPSS